MTKSMIVLFVWVPFQVVNLPDGRLDQSETNHRAASYLGELRIRHDCGGGDAGVDGDGVY